MARHMLISASKIDIVDFDSPRDALGFAELFIHEDRVAELRQTALQDIKKHPPCPGEIEVMDGGECILRGFHSPVHLLGFIDTFIGPQLRPAIQHAVRCTKPDKFNEQVLEVVDAPPRAEEVDAPVNALGTPLKIRAVA